MECVGKKQKGVNRVVGSAVSGRVLDAQRQHSFNSCNMNSHFVPHIANRSCSLSSVISFIIPSASHLTLRARSLTFDMLSVALVPR